MPITALTILYHPPVVPRDEVPPSTTDTQYHTVWADACRRRRRLDGQDWDAAMLSEFLRDLRSLICTIDLVPATTAVHVDTDQFVFHDSCSCGENTCAWCLGELADDAPMEYLTRANLLLDHYELALQPAPRGGATVRTGRAGTVGIAAPNFWWKPLGLRVWWGQHIGTAMRTDPPYVSSLIGRLRAGVRYRDTSLVKTATFSRL